MEEGLEGIFAVSPLVCSRRQREKERILSLRLCLREREKRGVKNEGGVEGFI